MRWAQAWIALLLLVAVLSPFIAGERPVVIGGETLKVIVHPLIPFTSGSTALAEGRYAPPLTYASDGHLHLLGTDRLGRDVAAGLVAGTRIAVWVGLGSVALALLIGLPLGAVAGFFGNDGLRTSPGLLFSVLTGLLVSSTYGYASLRYVLSGWSLVMAGVCLAIVVAIGCWLVTRLLGRWRGRRWKRSVALPVDRMVLFLIEGWSSVPGLIILVAVIALVPRPSLRLIILIIGLLAWPSIARFLRAELLRIRELTYISAARITGVGEWRLLWRHALPNAVSPLIVVTAFLVGSSILAEATLSFLGLGLPADQVTWGSLLQQSRSQPGAWWLAVFPGLLLTLTVLACNRLRR